MFGKIGFIHLMVLVATLGLFGCGGTPASKKSSSSNSSTDSSGVPLSSFQLSADFSELTFTSNNPGVVTYLHRSKTVTTTDTDWSKECAVSKSETDTNKKKITCLLEVNELDLWFNSFNLNWGAPEGMCSYVAVYPYWFFQYEADLAGAAQGVTVGVQSTDGSPLAFDPAIGGDGGGMAELHGETPSVYCKYDYSWMSPKAGPNCCEGTYTLNYKSCTVDDQGVTSCTTSTSTQNWGGQYGNCAAGPAAESTWGAREVVNNFPTGKIFAATSGIGKALSISSPSLLNFNSVAYSSNYVAGAAPQALSDVTSVQPSLGADYVFMCLDQNEDAIAQINLQIRKWNTYSELAKKHLGDPTVTGVENPFPGNKRDRRGWDDFVNALLSFPGLAL